MNAIKLPQQIKQMLGLTKKDFTKTEADAEAEIREEEAQAKLEEWKKRLHEAMEEHEVFRAECAAYDDLYGGTKQIRPLGSPEIYMSDRYPDEQLPELARQVVNIVFQLVEGQIDISLPMPAVEPTEEEDEAERRGMIEGQLTCMAGATSLRRVNSENERIAKKNGLAFFKVRYNPDYRAHTYRGRIETTNPHPTNVVLQSGVTKISDMDYMFHIENRTIDYICREYGEEYREQIESEGLEYGQLDYFGSSSAYSNEKTQKLSIVEAWYRDKESDIGVLTWVGDVILRDEPKFFYKRDELGGIVEYDDVDIPQCDEMGNVVGYSTVQVRCHVPNYFPFIPWYNIPREKSAKGMSDPYIIVDQQEGIKKLLSTEEKKHMKGTTKIFVRKGSSAEYHITDATSQIIATEDPASDVVTKDLKTPDNSLKDLFFIYQQAAKDALGVTEASQGRTDRGKELSGRALEILAANTQGRLGVKQDEKDIAYTELYRMWYDFLLAFADHRMPYRADGQYNRPIYGYWDKSKLIKQDDAGEWYYPEFDIFVQAEDALPKDKRFILDLANNAGNRIDNVQYWMLMESIGVPNASAILEMEQQKAAMQQQMLPPDMAAPMENMQQMPPEQPIESRLPPELVQILESLSPEAQRQVLQLPPEQQADVLMQVYYQITGGGGVEEMISKLPQEIQQIVMALPPEQQQLFVQLLRTDPQQAAAMLQQIMQGMQGAQQPATAGAAPMQPNPMQTPRI